MDMNVKCFVAILLMAVMSDLGAQGIYFEEGISIRNKQKGHYYKVVPWNDSQYKEFAYWEETEHGSIIDFMNWRAAFPREYDRSDTISKYPAIVVLHGNGSSGRAWEGHYEYHPDDSLYDNNGSQLGAGGREHLQALNADASAPRSFHGVLIYPQVSYGGAWTGENLTELTLIIEYMIREYHVDPDKIYLHGLSNGGKGTWDFATIRPDLFAAILPMSGVGSDIDLCTDILVTTPVWLFQGELDINPSKEWSQQWIDQLRGKDGRPRQTIYEDIGHGVWSPAYNEPDFFSWMLQHDKKNIYVFEDSSGTCAAGSNPLKLGYSAGYLDYQWTVNGKNVNGARTRYFEVTDGGTYQVRFRRRTNGLWAESFPLVIGDGGPIELKATNSVALPVPDDWQKTLDLVAPAGYPQYDWYKNGQLLKSTDQHSLTLNNEEGDLFKLSDTGIYSVRIPVDAGCPFQESNKIAISYREHQPVDSVYMQVTALALSSSKIKVGWDDIEAKNGYEIWRRRVNTIAGANKSAPGYPAKNYTFCGTTSQDITSFTDTGLRPGGLYVYQIRAIRDQGITVSGESVGARTNKDNMPPTRPYQLIAEKKSDDEFVLSWQSSTDNDVVYKYEIFNGDVLIAVVKADTADNDTTDGVPPPPGEYVLSGLQHGSSHTLMVRAVDYEGLENNGNVSSFSNPVTVETPLGDLPEKDSIHVYPNPFQEQITIEHFSASKDQQYRLTVFDVGAGKILDEYLTFHQNKAIIDLRTLSRGVYLLHLGTETFRVFKSD